MLIISNGLSDLYVGMEQDMVCYILLAIDMADQLHKFTLQDLQEMSNSHEMQKHHNFHYV
jgi:hypothetical protein